MITNDLKDSELSDVGGHETMDVFNTILVKKAAVVRNICRILLTSVVQAVLPNVVTLILSPTTLHYICTVLGLRNI